MKQYRKSSDINLVSRVCSQLFNYAYKKLFAYFQHCIEVKQICFETKHFDALIFPPFFFFSFLFQQAGEIIREIITPCLFLDRDM